MKTIQSTKNKSVTKRPFKRRFLPVFLGIALPAFALTALPVTSEAGHDRYDQCNSPHRRVIGHCGRCHTPVYSYYQVIGFESCGAPRYGWVNLPHQCSHDSGRHQHGHGHSDHHANSRYYSGNSNVSAVFDIIRRFR